MVKYGFPRTEFKSWPSSPISSAFSLGGKSFYNGYEDVIYINRETSWINPLQGCWWPASWQDTSWEEHKFLH